MFTFSPRLIWKKKRRTVLIKKKGSTLFIFSTSKPPPPHITPPSPEGRSGVPNNNQKNPRQLSTTSMATDHITPYSRPFSTPSTGLSSSHHLAPPVNPRNAAATAALCLQFQISVTNHQRHQPHPQQ